MTSPSDRTAISMEEKGNYWYEKWKHGVWNIIHLTIKRNIPLGWWGEFFNFSVRSAVSSHDLAPRGALNKRKHQNNKKMAINYAWRMPALLLKWARSGGRMRAKRRKSQMENIILHCFIILLKSFSPSLLFPRNCWKGECRRGAFFQQKDINNFHLTSPKQQQQ